MKDFLDGLVVMTIVALCFAALSLVVVTVCSNIAYEGQYQDARIDSLEAHAPPPDYNAMFCTQPRDRAKRQPFWFVLPRCHRASP